MEVRRPEWASLPPFASTAWHVGSSPTTTGQQGALSPLKRSGSSKAAPQMSLGNGSNGKSGSKRTSKKGSGGKAHFHFISSSLRYAAGGGGGAAAWLYGGGLAHACPLWPLGRQTPKSRSKRSSRVLILMSDTGGGHRASAEALRAGFRQLYGDKYQVDVVDLWTQHTPWPFNQLPRSYSFMVKYPFIWRFNFIATQPRFVHVPIATVSSVIVSASIAGAYDRYDPNLVLSVHPLMQHVPVRVLRKRIANGQQDPSTAFATVVTDLTTCHNTWFYPGVDRCYVATEETKRQALQMGLQEEQIKLLGLPIRPAFSQKAVRKHRLRKSLGMDLKKPAILLVGGGEGMGPVEATVKALSDTIGGDCQVVVICGRNAALVEKLTKKSYPVGMKVLVKGFVDNMPEFMSASDVIITKAGPGTISEALICGLPMVLNAFVPCQEEGNIPYVTENNVGLFETKPQKVAEIIKGWLAGGQQELKRLSKNAKAIAKPHALFDIVRDLDTLVTA